ncbi:MAG: hypothetical protein KIG36_07060, partial [Eubacteriales bacterium]|nr:hypothetical protein [Eubacteriales bacterium]
MASRYEKRPSLHRPAEARQRLRAVVSAFTSEQASRAAASAERRSDEANERRLFDKKVAAN